MVLRHANSASELTISSSDPEGRVVPIVRHTNRLELRLATGMGRGIDIGLTQPVALGQSGSGPDAILTQTPKPLESGGFGDPRLTFRIKLPEVLSELAWTTRLEMTLPLGNERAYIGERAFTGAILVNGYVALSRFSLVADMGVRIAPVTRFGDVNLGSHGIVGLGVDYRPFTLDVLHIAIEGMFRPMLVGAPTLPEAIAKPSWVVPAEWIVSASSRPWDFDLWFSLGAGTALPLSHRDGSSSRVASWFIAPTTSRWQALASVAVRN
ncbi:MAG TPA: hypothetical protein VKP30_11355 [Polyangiaceae bacterium]|nr:hypothetical protein [Polyangiaceae bacterium]